MTLLLTATLLLLPIPDPIGTFCPGLNYPAVMSVYDPGLGGINCDGDCTTVSTGLLTNDMYEVAGACPIELLGDTVYFPAIDHALRCVDTGGNIRAMWSLHNRQCVVYFDTLWHLEEDDEGDILGAPYWTWWMLDDWEVR